MFYFPAKSNKSSKGIIPNNIVLLSVEKSQAAQKLYNELPMLGKRKQLISNLGVLYLSRRVEIITSMI